MTMFRAAASVAGSGQGFYRQPQIEPTEPSQARESPPRTSGVGVSGEKSHFGDQCRACSRAGVVASGKYAEPDPAFP